MNELVERMKQIKTFSGADISVLTYPGYGNFECASFDNEFARVTGYVGLDWRYCKQRDVDREVKRCLDHDAHLCIFVSPPIPDPKISSAIVFVRDRWKKVLSMIGSRVHIAAVYVNLESYTYKVKYPLSDSDRKHNEWVGIYNRAIYRLSKRYSGGVDIRWHGHLAIHRRWPNKPSDYTDPYSFVDGGFALPWYNIENPDKCFSDLDSTIKYAHMHGVNSGSVCMAPGLSYIPYFCKGMPLLREVAGSVYENPYSTLFSFRAGRFFAHWWFDDQFVEDNPDFSRVDSIFLWPGNGHSKATRTDKVHRVALLEGVAMQINYDNRLEGIQKEMWEEYISSLKLPEWWW